MRRSGNGGWIVLGLALMAGVLLAIAWAWPKAQVLSIHSSYVGYYRGFGLFGKSFHRVRITDDHGFTVVRFDRAGFNDFIGYYTSGQIREEGRCYVSMNGSPGEPLPDIHSVESGRYYRPDGTPAGRIEKGTGTQTYWTSDGIKFWELELKNLKRVRIAMWHENGQPAHEQHYRDGIEHGRIVSYDEKGNKEFEGRYDHGEESGKWTYYRPDGTIERIRNYSETD